MLAEMAIATVLATGPDKAAGECSNYAYVGTGVSLCTKMPNAKEAVCDQVGAPVKVVGTDVWGLDRDGDKVGCESSEGTPPTSSSPTKTSSSPTTPPPVTPTSTKTSESPGGATGSRNEPQLPKTGPTAWALGTAGGVVLVLGAGAAYLARRRRINFTAQ